MKLTGDQWSQPCAATFSPVSDLANTVHELRTPLTSVLATLELLQTGELSPAESAELLDGATTAALHLEYLIDDILDAATLEAGHLRLYRERHRVGDLLDDLWRVMHLQALGHGVHLDIAVTAVELCVHTDNRRFLQIALNLVGNALKFSPRGGTVDLQVEATPGCVRFCVLDDGPGVPESARNELFLPFAEVTPDSSVRGTGLGLALCKQLISRLDGRIGFEPRAAGGSMFWFELPRAVAEGSASAR